MSHVTVPFRTAEEGPQKHWTILFRGTAFSRPLPLCLVSLWRCHLCFEDALQGGQGGSARSPGSLLPGRVRSSVLGLEGELQAGLIWVLEVKGEPLLYWHGGGKRNGNLGN